MGHIHNTLVVEFALWFEHRYQHSILATLLAAVVIKLLEEILVAMLGSRCVRLVLHLEHDGDVLLLAHRVAEDKVAFAALRSVVVFFEVCVRHHRTQVLLEEHSAVLLECLAKHLGGHLSFEVLVELYFLIFGFDQLLIFASDLLFVECHLLRLQFGICFVLGNSLCHKCIEACDFSLFAIDGLLQAILFSEDSCLTLRVLHLLNALQFSTQFSKEAVLLLDFGSLSSKRLLELHLGLLFGKLLACGVLRTKFFFAFCNLCCKLLVLHLANDVCVVSLINCKHGTALWAFDLHHVIHNFRRLNNKFSL